MSLLTILSARERTVLEMGFGLDGGGERTLEAIGHVLLLTRERIRQIEVEALTKLRAPLDARRQDAERTAGHT